jgi:uncharacterized protein YbaR (Trm112 family)
MAVEPTRTTVSEELLAILVCPACKGVLRPTRDGEGLDCDACRLRYPVRDGLPVMLVEEARPID